MMVQAHSLANRKMNLERLPWVRSLKKPVPCEGIKWGTVALRDIFPMGPLGRERPARGIQPRSRCKKQGRWHFTALKSSPTKSGNYCWHHLMQQMYSMQETERVNRWLARNGWID